MIQDKGISESDMPLKSETEEVKAENIERILITQDDLVMFSFETPDGEIDEKPFLRPENAYEMKFLLQNVIRSVPFFMVAGPLPNRWVVKFSEEVTRKLASGELHLLARRDGNFQATTVNRLGLFTSNAIIDQKAMNTGIAISSVGILWQILAIVTAQKYLSDISKRLTSIQVGIEEIREFLETRELSTVIGNLKYLMEISKHYRNFILESSDYSAKTHQLESIWREVFQLTSSVEKEIDSFNCKPCKKQLPTNYAKKFFESVTKYFQEFAVIESKIIQINFMAYIAAKLDSLMTGNVSEYLKKIESIESVVEKQYQIFAEKYLLARGLIDPRSFLNAIRKRLGIGITTQLDLLTMKRFFDETEKGVEDLAKVVCEKISKQDADYRKLMELLSADKKNAFQSSGKDKVYVIEIDQTRSITDVKELI